MNEKTIEALSRPIKWIFIAVVTATMLVLTFEHASRGLSALPTVAVYALTVGFGLEFLRAEWPRGARGRVRADGP